MSAAGISPAELIARRHGLGLSQAQLGAALARPVKQTMVSLWESGTRPIPDGLDTELQALEARSQRAYEAAYDEALRSGSPARIEVWADDAALWAARPEATGLPAVAYQAAAARAAQDARRDLQTPVRIIQPDAPPTRRELVALASSLYRVIDASDGRSEGLTIADIEAVEAARPRDLWVAANHAAKPTDQVEVVWAMLDAGALDEWIADARAELNEDE